jgi:hypothetical protein
MALNLSRIFKGRPEQVAIGDVNGDGKPDAVHDRYANQEVSYIGETEKHPTAVLEPTRLEIPNLVHDSEGINDQTPADWNERGAIQPAEHAAFGPVDAPQADAVEYGLITAAVDPAAGAGGGAQANIYTNNIGGGLLGVRAEHDGLVTEIDFPKDSYTATDDLWQFRDTNQDAGAGDEAARTAAPGHGFMMQDGELYPRGVTAETPSQSEIGEFHAPAPAQGEGYTATDDLWQFLDTNQDAGAGGEAARTAAPGHGFMMQDDELYPRGLRDMEISLGAVGEPQALTGDANGDGVVDAADYVVLRDRAPQGVNWEGPDPDASKNDGFTDDDDLIDLRSGTRPHGFQAIPELDANANSAVGQTDYNLGDTATHAHFGDTPGLNGGDMLAKNEVSIESIEIAHEGAAADGASSATDAAGFHALPEVDDEVRVSISPLDADADAPSTLVDIHTPGDVPVEHFQDHSGLLDALHDSHHDISAHHGGQGHESILDHIPDIDL